MTDERRGKPRALMVRWQRLVELLELPEWTSPRGNRDSVRLSLRNKLMAAKRDPAARQEGAPLILTPDELVVLWALCSTSAARLVLAGRTVAASSMFDLAEQVRDMLHGELPRE